MWWWTWPWIASNTRGGTALSATWRDDDRFHDECGLFGIWNHPEAANVTYLGLDALQQRGQESAGIAATDGHAFHTEKAMGWVADVFHPERLRRLPGHRAIGHVRYSTSGSSNLKNAQPITANTARGPISIAHNGNLINADVLRKEMERDGAIFQSTSDTEVILHLLARAPGAGRHRDPGARLRRQRRAGLLRGVGDALRDGADPQSLRGADVHRAQAGHPPLRREGEAQPDARDAAGQARGGRGRLDRARHDEPQDRPDAARRGRARGPHADLVAADPVALLLRHRHAHAQGADRVQPQRRGDLPLSRRRLARLSLPGGNAQGDRQRSHELLSRLLHRCLQGRPRAGAHAPAPPLRRLAR